MKQADKRIKTDFFTQWAIKWCNSQPKEGVMMATSGEGLGRSLLKGFMNGSSHSELRKQPASEPSLGREVTTLGREGPGLCALLCLLHRNWVLQEADRPPPTDCPALLMLLSGAQTLPDQGSFAWLHYGGSCRVPRLQSPPPHSLWCSVEYRAGKVWLPKMPPVLFP